MVPMDFGSPAGHRKYYEPTLWGDHFYAEASVEQFAELAAQHGQSSSSHFSRTLAPTWRRRAWRCFARRCARCRSGTQTCSLFPTRFWNLADRDVRVQHACSCRLRGGKLAPPRPPSRPILDVPSRIASADADGPNTPPPDADSSTPNAWSEEPKEWPDRSRARRWRRLKRGVFHSIVDQTCRTRTAPSVATSTSATFAI